MAEKRYRITAAVAASANYAVANEYKFRTAFQHGIAPPLVLCQTAKCPTITCTAADVMSTTNDWAQRCMEMAMIPKGLKVDGIDTMGTPGALVFEETTDPATIDLDLIFN